MTFAIKVSTKGQLVLPADIRRRFQIKPGDTLLADVSGESLLLRQEPKSNVLMKHILEAAFNCWQDLDVSGTDYVRALRDTDRPLDGETSR